MLEIIKRLVEQEFNIPDLSTRTKDQIHVDARTIYFVLCQRNTKYSLARTAELVDRTHATAIHAYKIYEQWLSVPQAYPELLSSIERLDDAIQTGIDEIDLQGDLLSIYRSKNRALKNKVERLLVKISKQEKELEELRAIKTIRH